MVPSSPGLYVLILRLPTPAAIAVGKLGSFVFPAGWYAYAGSARGPGGLSSRVSRHVRSDKALHWHIDYLRRCAELMEVWFSEGDCGAECDWAHNLARLDSASRPAARFGSSDCGCRAHLVRFPSRPDPRAFAALLGQAVTVDELDHSPGEYVGYHRRCPGKGP